MPRLIATIAEIAFIVLGFTAVAEAQKAIGAKSGVIQFSTGEVLLDGTPIKLEKDGYIQIENGQVLSTKKGYVELVLAPAAYLWLGEDGSLRMRQNKLSEIQLEIIQGFAVVEILETIKYFPINVHVSKSVIEIRKNGLYRLNAVPGQLQVYGGEALVKNVNQQIRIKKGRAVYLDGQLATAKFDVEHVDALHQLTIQRSSEISVWMRHSQIEAAMRDAMRGLSEGGFAAQVNLHVDEEVQRQRELEWKDASDRALEEKAKQIGLEIRQQQQQEQQPTQSQ
jgi:hypothetical protein